MKTCKSCQCEKESTTEFFSVDKSRKDGLFGICKECSKAYRIANKDVINARVKKLTELNKDRYRVSQLKWREQHREESAARTREWNATKGQSKEVRERKNAYGKKWRTENPHKNISKAEQYRAAQLMRVPSWSTEEDQWVFEEAALLAKLREKMLGGKWHVDHLYPLQGKLVSGLHVMDNLQVVPASFNLRKLNRYNPTVGPLRFLG